LSSITIAANSRSRASIAVTATNTPTSRIVTSIASLREAFVPACLSL